MSARAWCGVCAVGAALVLLFAVGGTPSHFVAPGQHDVILIERIERMQTFYGRLDDFPHTYRFTVTAPTSLSLQILVPDADPVSNDISGLLLESLPDDAGVREVKRLPAKDAVWESLFVWSSGDAYRTGPSLYDAVEPGTYLFEVSTPINRGRYALVVGTESERVGYLTAVYDLFGIKSFFEKSRVYAIQSPLLYVPLGASMLLMLIAFRWWKRRRG